MMLRFLSLFLPIKRLIWVKPTYSKRIVLRKLRRNITPDGHYFWVYSAEFIPWHRWPHRIEGYFAWHAGMPMHHHKYTDYIEDWGEFRPWWCPPIPPTDPPRLIEINCRAKKDKDGRLRKTRTLSEVWEQG